MQYEQIRPRNNLETVFINAPGSTSASLQIWFRAGSALEKSCHYGIAHFLEHMFFKGTSQRPGPLIAHQVEELGGELNAFTSFDYTCYYINLPSPYLKKGTEILLDMVANPLFREKDLIPERDVVLEEFLRSQDSPQQFSFQKLQEKTFRGSYRHAILGNPQTIKNFNRDQLINFRKKFYNLSNALLIVAGDIDSRGEISKITKVIEAFQLPSGPASTFPPFSLNQKPTVHVHKKDTSMAQLYLTFSAPPFKHKNSASEDLALNSLGYGKSSRFFKGLIQSKTLANSLGTSTLFMNNGGIHLINLHFPPESLELIIQEIKEIILKVLKEGFNEKEIQKIKNQYIASKIYDRESLPSQAFSLGHSFAQTGHIRSEEEFIERIKKTSLPEVNQGLERILNREPHLSLQIPQSLNTKEFESILKKFQSSFQNKIKSIKNKKRSPYKAIKSRYDSQAQWLKLKPGVHLIHRHNPAQPTFSLQAYLQGGLSNETSQTNGIYPLLAKTLVKGYEGKKYESLIEDLENKSATLKNFSGRNFYGLNLHGQGHHFEPLVKHFFGSLLSPRLSTSHISQEKKLTLRKLKANKDDPVKQCFEEADRIFFNGHPYSMPPLGNSQSVASMNQKSLQKLHKNNLRNKEVFFSYCGHSEIDEVLYYLEPHLSQIPLRSVQRVKRKKISPLKNQENKLYFDREQTQIFYGISTAPSRSGENIYLKILTTYLSGQGSELFQEVRDRQGLCYAIQPVHFSALESGYWGIYIATGSHKVEKALFAIKKIIEKINKKGLPKNQFNRLKRIIQNQTLLELQTNSDYTHFYSSAFLQGGKIDYYYLENESIKNLKYEDFQIQIKKILNRSWSTIMAGRF